MDAPAAAQDKKHSAWLENVGKPLTRYAFELYKVEAPATAITSSAPIDTELVEAKLVAAKIVEAKPANAKLVEVKTVEARYGSFSIISHHSIR